MYQQNKTINSDPMHAYSPLCLWREKTCHPSTTKLSTADLDMPLAWQPLRAEMTSHMTQTRLSTDKGHYHFLFHRERHYNRKPCTKKKKKGKADNNMSWFYVLIIPGTSGRCNIRLRWDSEMGIHSARAHSDPARVTELRTFGTLHLLERRKRLP